jgi:hypothetical protein
MFADDLLLFGEASENQMNCVMQILDTFCKLSGQEVSQAKTSILFSRNVSRSMRVKLLHMSGFRETCDLGKYLGVPLTGRAPKRTYYQYLIDQVSNKLAAWKARHLSFAGRVTLAKSVLEAVPIYPMMSSKIPKACLDEIQKIQRNFIWGDGENVRKFHAARWSIVTTPKQMGGLGLRKLNVMNQACLLKLGWKLINGCNDFWCEVLKGKYGITNLDSVNTAKPTDSAVWKALTSLKTHLDINALWTVGDGSSIDAWSQAWIEPGYTVMQNCDVPHQLQGARVCDLIEDSGQWNWSLLGDWMPTEIQNKIAAIPPPSAENESDERVVIGGNRSDFAVSVMYDLLCNLNDHEMDAMWKQIWKLNVTERVRCFIWLFMHSRLLTNQLKRKQVYI